MKKITTLYANKAGEIFDNPDYTAVVMNGREFKEITPEDLIPLPESAELMFLPDRFPVGKDKNGKLHQLEGRAVAAILPVGYTRLYLPAFIKKEHASQLPLFGYTAVVLYNDSLYCAAVYTDENHKWDPAAYNTRELKKLVKRVKKDLPDNRLVEHLSNCALEWHCCTAQNIFYRRWEAGIPASPVCNANCLGCISLQEAECCPSPQSRIKFKPSVEEIAELGSYHLQIAPDGIISFGQGCEGEPSLAYENIAAAIKRIRAKTKRGQININTNGGFTKGLKEIIDAGLDTMRVSIISAREESYQAYYRGSYKLSDVKETIKYALAHGIYVSLNLLYFPGFNDRIEEVEAWQQFFAELPVQMIQVRNLNIDPDYFLQRMPKQKGKIISTKKFLQAMEKCNKDMIIGNFSHYVQ